jgi:hypothetical protein
MHRVLTAIVMALLLVSPAGAQRLSHAAVAPASPQEYSPWSMQRCMLGVSYGAPMKLAVAVAGGLVYEHPDGGADVCLFGAAKAGFGGARGSLGVARSVGPLGGGVALSGGVLRTFAAPLNASANRTYIGTSLHIFPALALGGEIGWYTRVGDDPPAAPRRSMLTWSAGFGF